MAFPNFVLGIEDEIQSNRQGSCTGSVVNSEVLPGPLDAR
jgi:hypothetical protein